MQSYLHDEVLGRLDDLLPCFCVMSTNTREHEMSISKCPVMLMFVSFSLLVQLSHPVTNSNTLS